MPGRARGAGWGALLLVVVGCSSSDPADGDPTNGGSGAGAGASSPAPTGGESPPVAGMGGLAGNGGAGGVAGQPSDDEGLPDSEPCMPAVLDLDRGQLLDSATYCSGLGPETGLVNPVNARVYSLLLDAPLEAGSRHAFTILPPTSNTSGTVEIWGADTECGSLNELLWFGDKDGRQQCAEFVATQSHARLVFVTRRTDFLRVQFEHSPGAFSWCPNGACPGTIDGEGLGPGVQLQPPAGTYFRTHNYGWFGGIEIELGNWGRILSVHLTRSSRDNAMLAAAAFRLPPNDPYGDAWYCAGPGSSQSEGPKSSSYVFELVDVTRLPSCAQLGGTEHAELTWRQQEPRGYRIESSLALLEADGTSSNSRCIRDTCQIRVIDGGVTQHILLTLEADLGDSVVRDPFTAAVREAMWFHVPSEREPLQVTCSTSGSLSYDPDGGSTLQLEGLGSLGECSGEAVEPSTLRLLVDD